MKIKSLLLLILMILPICVYSQNTLIITSEQLKVTNLIFAEHEKFNKMIPLLELEIDNLKYINSDLIYRDSLNKIQISEANQIIEKQSLNINVLNSKVKTHKRIFTWGSVGIAVLIIIICLL